MLVPKVTTPLEFIFIDEIKIFSGEHVDEEPTKVIASFRFSIKLFQIKLVLMFRHLSFLCHYSTVKAMKEPQKE